MRARGKLSGGLIKKKLDNNKIINKSIRGAER